MDITHALFWACGATCAIAELLILRAAFRPTSEPAPASDVPQSPRTIEIVWAILPVAALVAIFWVAWRTLY